MTLAFIFIILFALILIICLTIIEDKIKVKQNEELEKNIKLMDENKHRTLTGGLAHDRIYERQNKA